MMSKEIIKESTLIMEYAVFGRGTFQYFAVIDQKLELPYIDVAVGDKYTFSEILLIVSKDKTVIGEPLVKDGVVEVEILGQEKTKKQYGLKYKAKSRYRRRYGYRQKVTMVRVVSIKGDGVNIQMSTIDSVVKDNEVDVKNVETAKIVQKKVVAKTTKTISAKVIKKAVNVSK